MQQSKGRGKMMLHWGTATTLVLSALVILATCPSGASARQLVTHSLSLSFDGATSTAGPFGEDVASVAVDETSGSVYVLTRKFVLDKFDANGNPSPFSAPLLEGTSSLKVAQDEPFSPERARLAVDNSTTSTQGRIYVIDSTLFHEHIYAFNPDGSPVEGNYPLRIGNTVGLSVDPSTGDFWTGVGDFASSLKYTSDGVFTEEELPLSPQPEQTYGFRLGGNTTGVDAEGNVYLGQTGELSGIEKYSPTGTFLYTLLSGAKMSVDPLTGDVYSLSNGKIVQFSKDGEKLAEFGSSLGDVVEIAANGTNGKVYAALAGGSKRVDIYSPGPTVTVPDLSTAPVSEVQAGDATLNGVINPEGEETTDCHFEWSADKSFSNSVPCAGGNAYSGTAPTDVSAAVSGLSKGHTYFYRVAAKNVEGAVSSLQGSFAASSTPTIGQQWSTDIHSDSVRLHSEIAPEGAPTSYHFEYGPEDCATSSCEDTESAGAGSSVARQGESLFLGNLSPETTYHYRVVVTNQSGTISGADHTFTTFPFTALLDDPCPNAHVRQQVGAALLPDCRAYELVSAGDTGGYNVESDLVPGQEPYGGFPDARERVLYGIHSGAIPGPWDPTNHGVDPYLATRGENGWSTTYAGIPADNPYATAPFSSSLDEANATLTTLAFGGPEICSPCFEDGSTGIPLRELDGRLVQGLAGPDEPGPGAESDGLVEKRFSADGSHFVFGSTSKFASGGNDGTGDVSIYDRDLDTGDTQVVSNDPFGDPLQCLQGVGECHSPNDGAGVAELGISRDGSRIVVGQLISTDANGNRYFHLYMHVGSNPDTIDLTPGTTTGAQYDGMTEDGSIIYFTTEDRLTTATDQDTDESADIYRSEVGTSSATLSRVSTGEAGTGDTDACNPAGLPNSWNSPTGPGHCDALAFAGGAGVAGEQGGIYFLSPEQLDTSDPQNQPVQDQANLYLANPGAMPHFVATIDTSVGKPPPLPPAHRLSNASLVSGLAKPESIAIDEANNDIYVAQVNSSSIARFTSSGAPDNFSVPGGSNEIGGQNFGSSDEAEIAVDNAAGSPFKRDLYVTENSNHVRVYAPTGEQIGTLNGFSEACGVAVDQSTGDVYVGDYSDHIWKFSPTANTTPVTNADYVKTGIETTSVQLCQVGVDTAGHVYAANYSQRSPLVVFNTADFSAGIPADAGTEVLGVPTEARALGTDPMTDELYVASDGKILERKPGGEPVAEFGAGQVLNPISVAINGSTGRIYVGNGGKVVEFDSEEQSYVPVDNPAILNATNQADTHDYADFQVTPGGNYAAFASTTPLTGYDNDGHYEVFRYDAQHETIECASCNPTGARAVGSSSLSNTGLSLTLSGSLFFNSSDAIAPRDLDSRQDVYEWTGETPELISTGGSPFDSSLLGVSADGKDAFFFTRDSLVPQDKNGTLVKLYDAREEGGFPFLPEPRSCKASDECHGPGSEAPPPAGIGSITGAGGNAEEPKKLKGCKKDFVRRGKRCMHRHHQTHHRSHSGKRGH